MDPVDPRMVRAVIGGVVNDTMLRQIGRHDES